MGIKKKIVCKPLITKRKFHIRGMPMSASDALEKPCF